MKKCAIDGCKNHTSATGQRIKRVVNPNVLVYCRKHCRWIKDYGTTNPPKNARGTIEFRFWKHVDKRGENDCWEWTADCSRAGYGGLWDKPTGKAISAHRYSYMLHYGMIPDGLHVMHSCDNKKCVNPRHLSLGTPLQNTRDAIERGLRKNPAKLFGEQNPRSKLTIEQVKFIRTNPEMKHTKLARMFGLSPNCIRGVKTGRTWKGV